VTRRLIAVALAVVLMVGAIAVLHATELPGRCQCETQGWGVWDWQWWAYDCWAPRPPDCDWT
jgi:hypothetical protein